MTAADAIVPDATVIVEHGRVAALGPSARLAVPRGARVVDGRGKWLMPGLADMHVHVPSDAYARTRSGGRPVSGAFDTQDQMTPFVANGVLQIFNLMAVSEATGQRMEVDAGYVIGPHMANAAMIDGDPPVWTGTTRIARTPADGRQSVRDIKVEGYDAVKPYSRLDAETFLAVVDEARKAGLPVVGHIPNAFRRRTHQALVPGFGLVAHAEEYAKQSPDLSDADIQRFVAAAKQNGTWLIATLTVSQWVARETRSLDELKALNTLRYVHPALLQPWLNDNRYFSQSTPERLALFARIVNFNDRLVRAFVTAGIPVLSGTDAWVPGVVPGFSLHDELELLAKDGMPNSLILMSATRLPAEWLGVAADRGTVQVGKRADLLLLDADPRLNVANTRKIAAVVLGGRWLPRAQLDTMLATLAKHNAAWTPPPGLAMGGGGAEYPSDPD